MKRPIVFMLALWIASPAISLAFIDPRPSKPPYRTLSSHAPKSNAVTDLAPHYTSPSVLAWLQKLALSYELERGEDLLAVIAREGDAAAPGAGDDRDPRDATPSPLRLAAACAASRLAIASHDFLRDPAGAVYNYGNAAFLRGFGYEWEEFVRTPSRACVETEGEVEERQRLLDAVRTAAVKSGGGGGGEGDGENSANAANDSAANYDNLIRVRKDGRRILLKGVNLWNIYDIGQQDMESSDSVRDRIERGELSAIGQAVWVRRVEDLD